MCFRISNPSVNLIYINFFRGLYLFTLKYFAKIVAWLSIFIILGSLIGIGAYMFVISKDYPYVLKSN